MPKSVHAGARRALNEILGAEDRPHAERAIDAFARDYRVKWPKAVAKVTGDLDVLLCFFDFPAEHWLHLRTTNPIESAFAPVRARTRVTKGPGNRDMGLAMVFKLLQGGLVPAGATFKAGKLVERPDETPDKEAGKGVDKVAAQSRRGRRSKRHPTMPDTTSTTRRSLTLMPDYHCFPLWESGADPYNVNPDDLPLSQALKQRLLRWAEAYDATLDHDYPPDSQFAIPAERTAFLDEGEQLCTALRAELGSGYTVAYRPLA